MSWFAFGEEEEEDPNQKRLIVERMLSSRILVHYT